MNVGELKAQLDDFGDHLPVVVLIERGSTDLVREAIEVDASSSIQFDPFFKLGDPVVTLRVVL